MSLMEQLKSSGFVFKKNLGQNFITDESFLESMMGALCLDNTDVVLEIGTGAGTLTKVLARKVKKVVTFEIDRRLEKILASQFALFKNIELVFADALRISDTELQGKLNCESWKLVANIPYYITTPLLMKFINIAECREICVLMQADVANRIVARTGGKDYGALSVIMQAYCDCKIIKNVPRNLFIPQPNVDSSFIKCTRSSAFDVKDRSTFDKLLKGMFSARRKTVLNGLNIVFGFGKSTVREILSRAGIAENIRPENVTVAKFVELSNIITTK